LGLALYIIAIGLSFIHVYLAFAIFVFVAAMYFMPKLGLQHKKDEELSISEIIAEDLYKMETEIEDRIHDTLHPNEGKTKKD
jgi:Na+/proline symporter